MSFSPRRVLSDLADSRTVAHGATITALSAALTLVDHRSLRPGARFAYRAASAVVAAWILWADLRTTSRETVAPATRAGLTAAAAGLTLGVAEAAETVDGRMQDALQRNGLRRPRLLMAAAGAALTAGSWWLGRRAAGSDAAPDGPADEEYAEEIIDLPDDVRALTAALLTATDAYGAPELRAQLEQARAVLYEGPVEGSFWPGIGFHVPEDLPRAVPGDANFPVLGRYSALGGRTFDVYLSVLEGRLGSLSISEASDWSEADHVAWFDAGRGVHELPGWPDVTELTLLQETPAGLQPAASPRD
ncbi:hypothetical protein [Microbacterium album]|uniref:Uncharacterized protein n=1 Tax=Microbacterium album TaxID=2053191 RepID=A0A917II36_9MICO|nr:hypothetical protein [Microbacterium album]GGH50636.1 hypothetical protein GCM10010921_29500 [Microbacterium album]